MWWTRVSLTSQVILHLTKEQSTISRSTIKVHHQEVKTTFNHRHSQVCNAIECSFGLLKNKWRMLLHMPSYPTQKQSKIISACMALHNYIRESKLEDRDFEECDEDEEFIPMVDEPSRLQHRRQRLRRASQAQGANTSDDHDMNVFRDWIADGLHRRR